MLDLAFWAAGTAAGAGIAVGSAGLGQYSSANASSYTFTTPPVVDGGAKLLLIGVYVAAFGARNNSFVDGVSTFTLNGSAPDLQLFEYLNSAAGTSDRYVQAVASIWNTPVAGDVGMTFTSALTGAGYYYMNLGGLHASPLGVLVREQVSTGTALPFQATTTASNSLLISINGTRNGNRGPFTFDDGAFTSLGEAGGTLAGDGSWDVGYRNGLATGTYDCGGDWANSDTSRIGGGAFELLAA